MARPATNNQVAEDIALIQRIAQGATQEFSVIVERYQDQVYGMILRQVGNPVVARDLAQETFVKAYRSLSAFRGDSALGTWLIRIALNVTSSHFSSKSYRQSLKNDSFSPDSHDLPGPSPEDHQDDQSAKVRSAILSLPPKYRDVVALLALEELPREQVAQTLGIPPGTVASRFHKAVILLKKKLLPGGAL